jgi:integrase
MARLTVRGIEALKPKASGSYRVTIDRGLYLRVATDGVKTWFARYRVGDRQLQARLARPYGSSGDEGHMSLAQAVTENARIQALARDGIDFEVERAETARKAAAERIRAQASLLPLRDLFEAWLAQGVSRKDGNAELRRKFERNLLPSLHAKPVRELTDTDLLTVLRHLGRTRKRAGTAQHLLTATRQMFGWAIKRQPWRSLLVDGNPADLVELKQVVPHGYQPVIRERTLCAAEIRELRDIFEQTTSAYECAPDRRVATRPLLRETQIALWTCLGTSCRIGELLQSRWEHVDFDKATWFVPRENTKTQVAWLVYLSGFTLRQFKELHALTGDTEWCYPARQQEGHVCVKSVTKQVGDRQIRFKQRKRLYHRCYDDSLVLADGANGAWTPHDLRRTAATMMQALRISPDVIDRCQNHVLPGSRIRRHYLHHDYAEEKREAWRLLGERIESIFSADNIIPLQRVA